MFELSIELRDKLSEIINQVKTEQELEEEIKKGGIVLNDDLMRAVKVSFHCVKGMKGEEPIRDAFSGFSRSFGLTNQELVDTMTETYTKVKTSIVGLLSYVFDDQHQEETVESLQEPDDEPTQRKKKRRVDQM